MLGEPQENNVEMHEVEVLSFDNTSTKPQTQVLDAVDTSQINVTTIPDENHPQEEEEEEEEEEAEEEDEPHSNWFKRKLKGFKKGTVSLVKATGFFLYHSDKRGDQYFFGNKLSFWFHTLLYLLVLYAFLAIVFIGLMELAAILSDNIEFLPLNGHRNNKKSKV